MRRMDHERFTLDTCLAVRLHYIRSSAIANFLVSESHYSSLRVQKVATRCCR